jgi:preprotein translocase subunit SecG
MITILTIIHIIVCIFLVSIVLLQHGKGADIGATFGGGGQSLFGTEGPVPILNKITTAAAVIFMITSISLAYISAHRTTGSVMGDYAAPAPVEQPGNVAEPLPERIPVPAAPAGETAPAAPTFPAGDGGKTSQ